MSSQITTGLWRLTQKKKLMEAFGSGCQRCGYNRCVRALQFHHVDSSEKKLWSKSQGRATFAEVSHHPERFELLCANCHFEEHDRQEEEDRVYTECLKCGRPFPVRKCDVERGRRKYCTKACADEGMVKPDETSEALLERMMKHVDKTDDGCWVWTGQCTTDHPLIGVRVGRNRSKTTTVRRVSYELHRGQIKKNLKVVPTCQTPLCVNPDHLKLIRSGRPVGYMPIGHKPKGPASQGQGLMF